MHFRWTPAFAGVTIRRMSAPQDIYPDSGSRLPLPRREDLDEAGRAMFDRNTDPKGGTLAGLRGPGGLRLHSPRLAELENALNRYLRFGAGFSAAVRELAILVTAREMESAFEWAAHEPQALKDGVPPASIDVVKHRRPTDGLSETEAAIIRLGREMIGARKVSPETFAAARRLFGDRQLIDLVSLMGHYQATASLLLAFDVQVPDGKPVLPR
jgi:4-carboxymuconolactone decarboxylase